MSGEQSFRISRLLSFSGFIAYFIYAAFEPEIELDLYLDLEVYLELPILLLARCPTIVVILALILRWRYSGNLLFVYQFYMVAFVALGLYTDELARYFIVPTAICYGIPLAYNWVKFGKLTLWLSRNNA